MAATEKPPTPPGHGPRVEMVPDGDNRPRRVCPECGFVHYRNPLVVAGSVCRWQDRILMCRRAIEPRRGYWTIPAGYMELGETAPEAAMREAREEANAEIDINHLLAVYSVPRISQVQLIYAADLVSPNTAPGVESLEVALLTWDQVPWDDLAFPTVRWALEHDREARTTGDLTTHSNPPGARGNFSQGGL